MPTDQPVEKTAANLVTGETREAFMNERMRIAPAKAEDKQPAKEKAPETPPTEEKKADAAPATEEEKKAEAKKGKLNERMSELTEARKKAEAKAEAAEAARLKAEAEAAELRAKAEPKAAQPDPAEPQRAQFNDETEYLRALVDYRVEQKQAERDRTAAEEREKTAAAKRAADWSARFAAAEKEIPDLKAKLEASAVVVSDQVREAIIESEVGPKLLNYLSDHPEEAEAIAKLTVGGALRAIGRIEAKLEAPDKSGTVTPEKKGSNVVEISRAPEPITPLKGNGAAAEVPINSKGEFHGTYAQWKALRKEGKIK